MLSPIISLMNFVWEKITFLLATAGGNKSLPILVLVFMLAVSGMWMYYQDDAGLRQFIGGFTLSRDVPQMPSVDYSSVAMTNLFNPGLSYYIIQMDTASHNNNPQKCEIDAFGSSTTFVWKSYELQQSQDLLESYESFLPGVISHAIDCGYTVDRISQSGYGNFIANFSNTSHMINSIRENHICADDQIMLNDRLQGSIKRNTRSVWNWFGSSLETSNLIDYDNSVVVADHTLRWSSCYVLYHKSTGERLLCGDVEAALGMNLNCSSVSTPVYGSYGDAVTSTQHKGYKGLISAVDTILFTLFELGDTVTGLFNFRISTIYVLMRDFLYTILLLSGVAFVLACIWSVQNRHI